MHCSFLLTSLQVLKQMQSSPHACQLVEHGTHQGHDYIVMELLGCNAAELRKAQAPRGRWGTHTVKQLGEGAVVMPKSRYIPLGNLRLFITLLYLHTLQCLHILHRPANVGSTGRDAPQWLAPSRRQASKLWCQSCRIYNEQR